MGFVRNDKKSENMLVMISEANAMKRKSEKQLEDRRKLEETLKDLGKVE